ncbi:acid type B receptor subunit 2 [Seminavis robusta]|uniref:Acid type B receptor subunit 2 n=1 Tax=Seminavis robusta TaxID=568900 RepID=A0A9N8ERW2_9STRA|nr:acid type B receptor subunit 2 [Seminavis robusta]|eukprot:Sro1432_g272110.1 acid type B receptor subunit 2 (551) ;mRNA; f:15078-16949
MMKLGEVLPLLVVLLPLHFRASALRLQPSDFPKQIHLKAGTFHAPPMMSIEEDPQSGNLTFTGFQPDLLKKLREYAAIDGVDLKIELVLAPSRYDLAFNLIANDCNSTDNPNSLEDCEKLDMLVSDYWSNPQRYMRAEFTPSWMRSTVTTVKYIEKPEGSQDFTTLSDSEQAGAAVCVPVGAYMSFVREKFPGNQYIDCGASGGNCVELLKKGDCVLYAHDELLLHFTALTDASLELTRENFNTQYIAWPMKGDLPPDVSRLLKKWMYRAVQTAALDELYFKYYKRERCPIGTAGNECELPCDPDHGTPDDRGKCVCESAKWTGDDCSSEVPEELNMLPSSIVHFAYGLASINFVLVSLCGLWLFRNRTRSQVKISQPLFLVIILGGCLISTSTIFAMAQQSAGDGPVIACSIIPWAYSVGFSLTFGALFARVRRIYQLLNSALRMKRVEVSTKDTLMTVALVLLIDVAVLTVWTIVSPLEWQRNVTNVSVLGEPLSSKGYCVSEYWEVFAGLIACFHCIVMAVACYMCYLARRIPERISNGKMVAISCQ